MATYVSPFSWSAVETAGELSHSYQLEVDEALLRLAETLNPMDLGVLVMQGQFVGGAGSDTLRVPDVTNLAGQRPTVLASETARPSYQSVTLGYTDFAVATYASARSQTYDSMIFNAPAIANALSIERYIEAVPSMMAASLRYLIGQAVAGISASVGSSAATVSYDTLIAASAAFNANAYSAPMGAPAVYVSEPTSWEHVKAAVRAEPGFQANGLATGVQGLHGSQYLPDPLGLGFDVVLTPSVTTASSAFQNALVDRGGIGMVLADVSRIVPAAGVRDIRIPALGIQIQEIPDGAGQATREAQYRQWTGVSMGSPNVFRQTRVLGATS